MIAARALGILGSRLATKFAAPNDKSFIKKASLFEILKKPCDWLIGITGMLIMIVLKITMRVPVVIVMSTT